MVHVALIGNPNVGKTTLFNRLTGSTQHVGNWPGVTVEKKEGFHQGIQITDLPGIYALDTYSNEEKVSKDFLEKGIPDVIINIVDASTLERNLYLTSQITAYNIPMVIALNMGDIADRKGLAIDPAILEQELGIRVVPILAARGAGLSELVAVVKEKDFLPHPKINPFDNEVEAYREIGALLSKATQVVRASNRITRTLDRFVLNPYLAYPLFLFLMYVIFKFTFSWVGTPLAAFFEEGMLEPFGGWVETLLSSSSPWFQSLLVDGIIGGVGAILVFLPVIMTLFFGISLLEDSGYMARAALIMDRFMRRIGLSGKAFIPLLIGFGCTVPAIMSSRTLESDKDRKLTAILAPFMSCNAKLPVFVLFASVFFSQNQDLIVFGLYLAGVLVAFLVGLAFKNTLFKKDEEPFIIELPEYKLPNLLLVLKSTWDKGKEFLKKASTIIFAMAVVIWFLSNFNFSGMSSMDDSILATIGKVVAPIFRPLGFGEWQAAVALITGILAKEVVVSTMGVIYGVSLSSILPTVFTQAAALSFLVFVLLYTPCVAVIATMRKEYGTSFALVLSGFYFALAWMAAVFTHLIATWIF